MQLEEIKLGFVFELLQFQKVFAFSQSNDAHLFTCALSGAYKVFIVYGQHYVFHTVPCIAGYINLFYLLGTNLYVGVENPRGDVIALKGFDRSGYLDF
jgi:hypothetical protein